MGRRPLARLSAPRMNAAAHPTAPSGTLGCYAWSMQDQVQPRILKVFVASPSDVAEEREALARLIRDINDVLTFLTPEKRLSLELVRYETHAYPDIGAPQDVINRQIPVDYDIFIGVMWKRAGTPTRNAASGTIEEFQRAVDKRKTSHLPRIMFYFCDAPIAMPSIDEIAQIAEVVKFRDSLSKLGLTESYPTHAAFTEHVRSGLLRAVRDILQAESLDAQPSVTVKSPETVDAASQSALLALVEAYEKIRRTMDASAERTQQMTAVFSQMKSYASGTRGLLEPFHRSNAAGERLAAVAILQMFPDVQLSGLVGSKTRQPGSGKALCRLYGCSRTVAGCEWTTR